MKTIETIHNTFSKRTKQFISKNIEGAKSFKKVSGNDVLIKDISGKTIAVWMKRICNTGIIKVF